jgi:hypothetical protein
VAIHAVYAYHHLQRVLLSKCGGKVAVAPVHVAVWGHVLAAKLVIMVGYRVLLAEQIMHYVFVCVHAIAVHRAQDYLPDLPGR